MDLCDRITHSMVLKTNIYSGRYRTVHPHISTCGMRHHSDKYLNQIAVEPIADVDIRSRTKSMPTKSNFQKLEGDVLGLCVNCRTRSFEMNEKGVIVSSSESLCSHSSNSVFSSEGGLYQLIHPSIHSTTRSEENMSINVYSETSKVHIIGYSHVGKTALAQQFITSEYLGGFNTSSGKYKCNMGKLKVY